MDNNVFEKLFCKNDKFKFNTETCLTDYYKKQGYNVFKSAEFAQNNILNFVEFVNDSIKSAQSLNVPYIFSFASKDVVTINESYFPIRKIETNLIAMDWQDFELISSIILETCFGAVEVKTTQATADGGLDFEGKIPILSSTPKDCYGFIKVYGQSKKYSSNVGIYDIKSFVAFANSKKRNYVHPAQLFVFFTTSNFASNALTELDTNGFIGLSGFQLAKLIYCHKDNLWEKSNIFNNLTQTN